MNGGEPIEYKKNLMKMRFESYLPLGKILNISEMVIHFGSVFQENKYYPQVCLHEWMYEFVNEL